MAAWWRTPRRARCAGASPRSWCSRQELQPQPQGDCWKTGAPPSRPENIVLLALGDRLRASSSCPDDNTDTKIFISSYQAPRVGAPSMQDLVPSSASSVFGAALPGCNSRRILFRKALPNAWIEGLRAQPSGRQNRLAGRRPFRQDHGGFRRRRSAHAPRHRRQLLSLGRRRRAPARGEDPSGGHGFPGIAREALAQISCGACG